MDAQIRILEGRHVNVALRGGDRIDDCQLVSAGRGGTGTVWLFWNSIDVFIPVEDVVDVWEAAAPCAA